MPDFLGLMKQAAQLQSKMQAMQAELAQTSAAIAESTADYAYRVRREILDYQTGTLR